MKNIFKCLFLKSNALKTRVIASAEVVEVGWITWLNRQKDWGTSSWFIMESVQLEAIVSKFPSEKLLVAHGRAMNEVIITRKLQNTEFG